MFYWSNVTAEGRVTNKEIPARIRKSIEKKIVRIRRKHGDTPAYVAIVQDGDSYAAAFCSKTDARRAGKRAKAIGYAIASYRLHGLSIRPTTVARTVSKFIEAGLYDLALVVLADFAMLQHRNSYSKQTARASKKTAKRTEKKVQKEERLSVKVEELFRKGLTDDAVMKKLGISKGSLAACKAHITMRRQEAAR